MPLAAAAVLVALVVGRLLGGRGSHLADLPLSRLRLPGAALALQVVGAVAGGPLHALALAGSAVLVGAFLAGNRGVRGLGLVALGLLANAVVVSANGAMPVSAAAAARAGVPLTEAVADARHEQAGRATRLPWLGDVVPVPLPAVPVVVSPGDVLVAAGLGQLVLVGMLRTPAPRHQRGAGSRRS